MHVETEKWKPVEGYEGLYEVSDMGRVANVRKGRKLLSHSLTVSGYPQLGLHKDGVRCGTRLHRLVAKAFCFGYAEGLEVNHINGVKTDNRACNLEWCTHTDNMHHKDNVLGKHNRGAYNLNAIFRPEQITEIVQKIHSGTPITSIASEFNVSLSAIYHIKYGETWSHITGITPRSKAGVK